MEKSLDDIIYEALDEIYPSGEGFKCAGCRVMDGCRSLGCPNLKLYLARKISKKIKENGDKLNG